MRAAGSRSIANRRSKHGERLDRYRPNEDGTGFVKTEELPLETFSKLGFDAILGPGDCLVIGWNAEQVETLGQALFSAEINNRPRQRVLVIRAYQNGRSVARGPAGDRRAVSPAALGFRAAADETPEALAARDEVERRRARGAESALATSTTPQAGTSRRTPRPSVPHRSIAAPAVHRRRPPTTTSRIATPISTTVPGACARAAAGVLAAGAARAARRRAPRAHRESRRALPPSDTPRAGRWSRSCRAEADGSRGRYRDERWRLRRRWSGVEHGLCGQRGRADGLVRGGGVRARWRISGTAQRLTAPLAHEREARERFGQFVAPFTVRAVEADHRESLGRVECTLGG